MFNVPELRVILITVGARRGRDARRAGGAAVDHAGRDGRCRATCAGAFRELRRLGIERMSCIGGRTLAAPLLDAGLVQDLYLTTGAKAGGEPDTPFYDKPLHGREVVRKHGTGADAGVVFEHIAD